MISLKNQLTDAKHVVLRKRELLDAVIERLKRDLHEVTSSQKAAAEGATHAEARAEHDKDTRATEASYVARGLAKRVHELTVAIQVLSTFDVTSHHTYEKPQLGSLVTLDDETQDVTSTYFVLPHGGGTKIADAAERIAIVSPQSPLGKAILRAEVDEEIKLGPKIVTLARIE